MGVCATIEALQFWFIFKYWEINACYALIMALISVVAAVAWLPESPKFFFAKKEFEKCRKVMEIISERNLGKRLTFEFADEFKADKKTEKSKSNAINDVEEEAEEKNKPKIAWFEHTELMEKPIPPPGMNTEQDPMELKGTLGELCGIAVFRKNLMLLVVVWSFGAFAFFIIPFYIGDLPLNIYMMDTSTGIAQILAAFLAMSLIKGKSKIRTLAIFLFVTFVGCICLIVLMAVSED